MNRSVYIASRMVARKPVLLEGVGELSGTMVGTPQPPLNMGDNEVRANNVGDPDAWAPADVVTPQGKAAAIRRKMDQKAKSAEPKVVDQLPPPLGDNQPPTVAGTDNFPALQMPADLR